MANQTSISSFCCAQGNSIETFSNSSDSKSSTNKTEDVEHFIPVDHIKHEPHDVETAVVDDPLNFIVKEETLTDDSESSVDVCVRAVEEKKQPIQEEKGERGDAIIGDFLSIEIKEEKNEANNSSELDEPRVSDSNSEKSLSLSDASSMMNTTSGIFKFTWTHEMIMLFLRVLEKHKKYIHINVKRKEIFMKVQKEFSRHGYAITLDELLKKYNNMVRTFRRVQERIETKGMDSKFVNWPYYDEMLEISKNGAFSKNNNAIVPLKGNVKKIKRLILNPETYPTYITENHTAVPIPIPIPTDPTHSCTPIATPTSCDSPTPNSKKRKASESMESELLEERKKMLETNKQILDQTTRIANSLEAMARSFNSFVNIFKSFSNK